MCHFIKHAFHRLQCVSHIGNLVTSDRIGIMEILFPASMLAIGLIIGGLFIWLTNRTKLKYEYDRARAEIDTERATLAERLSGKEEQARALREALDREVQQTNGLRAENAQALAELSALTTRLEEERKSSQEKLELLSNAEEKL